MARGKQAEPGDTRVSVNGYHYTRTTDKWRLTHHMIAETTLGRPLQQGERVSFIDGNKKNLDPVNLKVSKVGSSSTARKRAQIEARIAELQAQLEELS